MRILFLILPGLLALPTLLPRGASSPSPSPAPAPGPEVCATGCAAASTAQTTLAAGDFHRLLGLYAHEALDGPRPALDELLFHAADTLELASRHGLEGLDAPHRDLLLGEAARTHALLSVRFVDEAGTERLLLPPTRVPLGVKQHLFPELAAGFDPPEISGTVRRVGLDYLWTRL